MRNMRLLAQGIQGVRFKRLIMDESASDRSPQPPAEEGFKRLVFCSGKVRYNLKSTALIQSGVPRRVGCWQCNRWDELKEVGLGKFSKGCLEGLLRIRAHKHRLHPFRRLGRQALHNAPAPHAR